MKSRRLREEDGRMNYEDKVNARLAKIETERANLLLDLDLLYKRNGLGWNVCPSSDSGLVELACWCAECKDYAKDARAYARIMNEQEGAN